MSDSFTNLLILLVGIFFLVTIPLLVVAHRLSLLTRAMYRIEGMNVRSLQRWGG